MKKFIALAILSIALAAMPTASFAQNVVPVTDQSSSNVPAFNYTMPSTPTGLSSQGSQQYQGSVGVQTGGGSCSSLTTSGLAGVVGCFIGILNDIVYVLMAAGVVYVVLGAFQMMQSEEKREAGRDRVIYGVIGLFAMISVWGFVNILDRTFNLSSTPAHRPPSLVAQ